MDYEIIQVDAQTWRIENSGVRMFLLAGTERALLVDSGMTITNAREIAEGLTQLPIQLINTHADRDHIAGNDAFETVLMHPAEYVNYYQNGAKRKTPTPVWDGDIIQLGEREIEVISIPGHTPGSIALLDKERRVLISGDPIQDGRIYMFGVMRNMQAYRQSLEKIQKRIDEFDAIWPSHGTFPAAPEIIQQLMEAADRMERGEIEPTTATMRDFTIHVYDAGVATFLRD